MNYFVVIDGHISWHAQYESALQYAKDFEGYVFNVAGLPLVSILQP